MRGGILQQLLFVGRESDSCGGKGGSSPTTPGIPP